MRQLRIQRRCSVPSLSALSPLARRGISPVIVTLVLTVVAITATVAASFWSGGIVGQFTKFEKVEIQSAWSELNGTFGWLITLEVKNSGTASTTLNKVFINDRPLNQTYPTGYGHGDYDPAQGAVTDIPEDGLTLESGESRTVRVWILNTYGSLSSGTTLDLKLHSVGGKDYIKLIRLV